MEGSLVSDSNQVTEDNQEAKKLQGTSDTEVCVCVCVCCTIHRLVAWDLKVVVESFLYLQICTVQQTTTMTEVVLSQ